MRPRSLARAALSVSALYAFGSLIGFAQRVVVTTRFGTSAEYDAFNAAFRIPDLLFSLLAGGALASAFIPIFVAHLSQGRVGLAWRLARAVVFLVCGALAVLAALAALLAPWLVGTIVAPGFDDGQVELTTSLMRIMLLGTVVFGASGLMMGVLQSNGAFIAPALAPSLYNLGIIFGATALHGFGIYGVAFGVVIGALLHLGVQLPSLARVLRNTRHAARDASAEPANSDPIRRDVRQVVRLMLPRIAGLGAVQINFIVNTNLASGMGVGAVSALNIAFAVMILPQVAIAQAIATVLFPSISAHAARDERAEYGAMVTRAVGAVLALSVPAAFGLILLGQPLIGLLFERGAFGSEATQAVAFTLAWFAVGLAGHSVLEVVTRGFYALQDTLRPVVLGVISMAVNIALSLALSAAFGNAGLYPYGGLALANSLATAIETAVLLGMLARRNPAIAMGRIAVSSAKSVLSACVMAAALVLWLSIAGDGPIAVLSAIPAGAAVYAGVAFLLRSEEARVAAALARSRLGRFRRP